jgi:hypothetical protein
MYYYWNGIAVKLPETNYEWVDTSKYDVVEKKEAKIERLNFELDKKKRLKRHYEDMIDVHTNRVLQIADDIEKLEVELGELEG